MYKLRAKKYFIVLINQPATAPFSIQVNDCQRRKYDDC